MKTKPTGRKCVLELKKENKKATTAREETLFCLPDRQGIKGITQEESCVEGAMIINVSTKEKERRFGKRSIRRQKGQIREKEW